LSPGIEIDSSRRKELQPDRRRKAHLKDELGCECAEWRGGPSHARNHARGQLSNIGQAEPEAMANEPGMFRFNDGREQEDQQ
jgi:hypothetical protein